MSRRARSNDEPGFDSFLDIVANLVGILVILIMVIGVRAKEAFKVTEPSPLLTSVPVEPSESDHLSAELAQVEGQLESLRTELSAATREAELLHADVHNVQADLEDTGKLVAAEQARQEQLAFTISLAEKALSERREKLSSNDQSQLMTERRLEEAKQQVGQLDAQIQSVASSTGAPTVLKHRPTPMAKTVFGKEVHFRLLGGRLAYVPLTEMCEKINSTLPNKRWKLANAKTVTEVLGPRDGFRMRYTLQRRKIRVEGPEGMILREIIEPIRAEMVPASPVLGEPIQQALSANSEFMRRISAWNPSETTITVWTYPDSYGQYRQLREFLHARGFLTAARPRPEGISIAAGTNGSKSVAE